MPDDRKKKKRGTRLTDPLKRTTRLSGNLNMDKLLKQLEEDEKKRKKKGS